MNDNYATIRSARDFIFGAAKDNVKETGAGERYPTARQIKTRSTPGVNGEPYFQSTVRRSEKGQHKTGHGDGPTKQDATDKAYRNAGGTVNPNKKHNFQ